LSAVASVCKGFLPVLSCRGVKAILYLIGIYNVESRFGDPGVELCVAGFAPPNETEPTARAMARFLDPLYPLVLLRARGKGGPCYLPLHSVCKGILPVLSCRGVEAILYLIGIYRVESRFGGPGVELCAAGFTPPSEAEPAARAMARFLAPLYPLVLLRAQGEGQSLLSAVASDMQGPAYPSSHAEEWELT